MSKITEYTKVQTYDQGDVVLIDGQAGTRTLPVEKAGVGIDSTLTVSGKAADVKKVGDEINDLKSDLEEIDGVDLMLAGRYKVRNGNYFTFSKGAFTLRRSSSAVGNAAIMYCAVADDDEYICEIYASGCVQDNVTIAIKTFTTEPTAYSDTGTNVAVYSSFGTSIDKKVRFSINSDVSYIALYVSAATSQADYLNGHVSFYATNNVGKLRDLENELYNKADLNRVINIENLDPNVINPEWVIGGIQDSGAESSSTTRARSNFIDVKAGESLKINHNSYYWCWFRYNTSGVFQEKSSFSAGWSQTDGRIIPTEDSKYRIMIRNPSASSDIVYNDIDVNVTVDTILLNTINELLKLAKGAEWEYVLPRKFYWCGGVECNIYYQNFIIGKRVDNFFRIETTLRFNDYDNFTRWTPAANASLANGGHKFYFYPDNEKIKVESDILLYDVVPNTAGSGLTKKVLMIGDSITYNYQSISRHLINMFDNDAMSIELLGTMGESIYQHEGRPGWSALDYVSGLTFPETTYQNAFWNPTTEKFDFAYYMSQQGYSGVDYVFLNLGTNDTGNVDGYETGITEIVQSIHEYDSNIRIGVWLCPPRSYLGNGNLVDSIKPIRICQRAISLFDNQQSNRIYLVPVYFNVDPYHDFPYEEVNVSARNSDFKMFVATDKVHPSAAGYQKIGDVIYCYIKYFGSLDS